MDYKSRKIITDFILDDYHTTHPWAMLGLLMDKLVEKGLWEGFIIWLVSNEILGDYTYQEKYLLAAGDIGWLFRPVDEKGDPHFCGLVAEFLQQQNQDSGNYRTNPKGAGTSLSRDGDSTPKPT